jgi:hypothetical protein
MEREGGNADGAIADASAAVLGCSASREDVRYNTREAKSQ